MKSTSSYPYPPTPFPQNLKQIPALPVRRHVMRGDWLDSAQEYREVDRLAGFNARIVLAYMEYQKWVARIRNPAKRDFADAYGRFRFGALPFSECEKMGRGVTRKVQREIRQKAEGIYIDIVGPCR